MHLDWPQSISPNLDRHHYGLTMDCWKKLVCKSQNNMASNPTGKQGKSLSEPSEH